MIIIGEKINVMSKTIGPAMRERDAGPIVEMAKAQLAGGADYLDVNIGPATKAGDEMMAWLVRTIQEACDGTPLCLDTSNPVAMEAGLAAHDSGKGKPIVNSTSGAQERLDAMVPLAAKHDAMIIGLCTQEKGIPRDANARMSVAADLMGACMMHGVPLEDLILDPLVLPVCVPGAQNQVNEVFQSVKMFQQLNDPPLKSVVGLSNISNGVPGETKPLVDRTFLAMLASAGLWAAIADPLDVALMSTVKTIRVLEDEVVYCHSFLEL
jgi:5-methyltetrahydrofolate corrinoid/iron sulfur protein methyltransferase